MEQVIILRDIYKTGLYARSRAKELLPLINPDASVVKIDFTGIDFISRSFADELFNIEADLSSADFVFINRVADVEVMMEKVREGRLMERRRGTNNARIYDFDNISSLSTYLMTI